MLKIRNEDKKLRIALIIPPPQKHGPLWCPNFPMGIAYLAAVLENSGYDLTVIDCPAFGIDHKKLEANILSLEPQVVGITSLTPMIQSTLLAANVVKKVCSDTVVILGGPHATFMDRQILSEEPAVDMVVRGEGEETIIHLLSTLAGSGDLEAVLGISFRKNGRIIRTLDRPLIQNLDALPRPTYKYFPLRKYQLFGKSIFPIMTSRGCPFQCSYCVSSQLNGKRFRSRSIGNVVDELEWLRDEYGADAFTFYDDIFTFDVERALKICEEIKNRKIGLPWDCQTRVDRVSPKVLAKMREAGCELVSFGVESGSQKILDAMKKGTTVEQNEKAIKWAKQAGLSVSISVILGYPGETEETLKQTINFIKKTQPDYVYLCLATPYPGTNLRELIEELGWNMSREWSQYDMETPVFENPLLSSDKLVDARKKFYNSFYSPVYIFHQLSRRNFYNQIMARTALNHILWRTKIPKIVSAILKR